MICPTSSSAPSQSPARVPDCRSSNACCRGSSCCSTSAAAAAAAWACAPPAGTAPAPATHRTLSCRRRVGSSTATTPLPQAGCYNKDTHITAWLCCQMRPAAWSPLACVQHTCPCRCCQVSPVLQLVQWAEDAAGCCCSSLFSSLHMRKRSRTRQSYWSCFGMQLLWLCWAAGNHPRLCDAWHTTGQEGSC